MIIKSGRELVKSESVHGGAGYILKDILLSGELLGEHCKMFNEILLKPGCEIGYHPHIGDTETYYIIKGSGTYNDNGKEIKVSAGDVTFCAEGQYHGLVNDGDEDIVMLALILTV